MKIRIAESEFVIEATPERLWNILPMAVFDGVEGMEKIEVVSDRFFRAVMPVSFAFLRLNARLSGEISDISESETLAVDLKAKVIGRLIQVNQKIIFTLSPKDNSQTAVKCEILAEGKGPIFRWVLVPKARVVSRTTIDNMQKIIKRLA